MAACAPHPDWLEAAIRSGYTPSSESLTLALAADVQAIRDRLADIPADSEGDIFTWTSARYGCLEKIRILEQAVFDLSSVEAECFEYSVDDNRPSASRRLRREAALAARKEQARSL